MAQWLINHMSHAVRHHALFMNSFLSCAFLCVFLALFVVMPYLRPINVFPNRCTDRIQRCCTYQGNGWLLHIQDKLSYVASVMDPLHGLLYLWDQTHGMMSQPANVNNDSTMNYIFNLIKHGLHISSGSLPFCLLRACTSRYCTLGGNSVKAGTGWIRDRVKYVSELEE